MGFLKSQISVNFLNLLCRAGSNAAVLTGARKVLLKSEVWPSFVLLPMLGWIFLSWKSCHFSNFFRIWSFLKAFIFNFLFFICNFNESCLNRSFCLYFCSKEKMSETLCKLKKIHTTALLLIGSLFSDMNVRKHDSLVLCASCNALYLQEKWAQ